MLGWEFFVIRQSNSALAEGMREGSLLASWRAGLGGTQWLYDLVESGVATDLGGNGYPCRYEVPAHALVAALAQGPPKHTGPPIFGSDYALPGGWTGQAKIDLARLRSLDPNEILLVEAWDQS